MNVIALPSPMKVSSQAVAGSRLMNGMPRKAIQRWQALGDSGLQWLPGSYYTRTYGCGLPGCHRASPGTSVNRAHQAARVRSAGSSRVQRLCRKHATSCVMTHENEHANGGQEPAGPMIHYPWRHKRSRQAPAVHQPAPAHLAPWADCGPLRTSRSSQIQQFTSACCT